MTPLEQFINEQEKEFDLKFLYKLNQIALSHLYVELYADQLEFLQSSLRLSYEKGTVSAKKEGYLEAIRDMEKEMPKEMIMAVFPSSPFTLKFKEGYNKCHTQILSSLTKLKENHE